MIAVTGATGHLGNTLIRELLAQGRTVRAIVPPNEAVNSLQGLQIEIKRADIRDKVALKQAVDGVEALFHLAGLISISKGNDKLMYDVNVTGTKNIIEVCLEQKIKRLIYTSSVHAFAEPQKGITITENTPILPESAIGTYAKTKALATLLIEDSVQKGLDATILFPSGVIGPYDYKLSEMGQLFLDYAKGFFYYVNGQYDFVDVRDVVSGIISAYEHGEPGERFILSGHLLKIRNILYTVQEVTNRRLKSFLIPMPIAHLASNFSPFVQKFSKKKPRFTPYSLYVLQSNSLFSYQKASEKLGYQPRSFFETAKDSISWFMNQGILKKQPHLTNNFF